jgi:hypothetical protein
MLKATPSPLLSAPPPGGAGGESRTGGRAGGGAGRGGGDGSDSEDGARGDGAAVAAGGGAAGGGRKRPRRARTEGGGSGSGGGGGGEGAAGAPSVPKLTRPLLCICNDLYAPALRELRPLVQVVEFRKAAGEKLLARLRAIVAAEGMAVSREALASLISLTDGDVRSCLHTLQYLRGQQRREARGAGRVRVTADMLAAAAVGAKDQTRALFDVWGAAFRIPDTRRRAGGVGAGAGFTSLTAAASAYRAELFNSAAAFSSEPALLLAGLHENLLSARGADPTMQHTASALEWLCFGEEVTHRALSKAAFPLLKYFPAAVVGVHLRVASELRVRLEWPGGEGAFRRRRDAARNVVAAFQGARAGAPRKRNAPPPLSLGGSTVVMDVAPPLVSIAMCAPLRTTSFTLMNSKERQSALDMVDFLVGAGLTFAVVGGAAGRFDDADYSLVPCVCGYTRVSPPPPPPPSSRAPSPHRPPNPSPTRAGSCPRCCACATTTPLTARCGGHRFTPQ